MRTIFKTKLDVCDYQTVELPQDYKIIHVAMQQDTPCNKVQQALDISTHSSPERTLDFKESSAIFVQRCKAGWRGDFISPMDQVSQADSISPSFQ